jgi:hypothetical protein
MSKAYLQYLENSLKNREVIDLTRDSDSDDASISDSDSDEYEGILGPRSKKVRIPVIESNATNDVDREKVYISPSTLGQDTGLGLFAKKQFKVNDYICSYLGNIIPTDTENDYESDYVLMYDNTHSIDSDDPASCYARYANDAITSSKINSRFSVRRGVIALCLRATKTIKAGDEIFVSYGDDYWKCDKFFYLPANLQKTLLRRNADDTTYKARIDSLR